MSAVSQMALLGSAPSLSAPTLVGSTTLATAPTASFTITTSAAVAAGSLLVIYVAWGSTATPSVSTISDGTNSYATAASLKVTSGTNVQSEIWYVANAAAVASGATITITMTGAGSGGSEGTIAYCYQVANAALASPFDIAASSVTNTTTPSVATGTLAQVSEIVFGASYNNNGSGVTYTEASGFTNLTSRTGSVGQCFGLGYKITAATTTVTYAPTWSGVAAVNMTTQAAAFKGR